jgi:branched-chain amino acid transport system permease protein
VDNVLAELTREYQMPGWIILDGNNFGQVKFILVGIGLVLLVVFRPQGIFGDKREQVFDVR